MSDRPLLVLIDGHAVAYRMYFALPAAQFTARSGQPTNAVWGFTRTLLEVLEETPDYLAVSFDRGLSGREDIFPEYKGTRDKMPDDLRSQMDQIEAMVAAFNVPMLMLDGFEADDIIGTTARQAEALGCQVKVITGDRDLLQLLSEHTHIQLPVRGKPDKVWDLAAYQEKYKGISPVQLTDLKGLMGDSSDNIPGVKGIGEKTGLDLITKYGDLPDIYEHLEAISKSARNKLEAERDMAFLSKDLATIKRDAPITLDLDACHARDFDPSQVLTLFDELDFGDTQRDRLKKLVDKHTDMDVENVFKESDSYIPPHTVVTQKKQLDELVKTLAGAKFIAFDTETTGLDKMVAELVGISLAVSGNYGYYIPVGHVDPGSAAADQAQPSLFDAPPGDAPEQLALQTVIDALRPALTNPKIGKVAHNAEYDLVILRRYGIDVSPIVEDTMIGEFVTNPASRDLGLKALSRSRLGIKMKEISELLGTGKKQITMDRVPVEDAAGYAAADAVLTFQLMENVNKDLADPKTPKARKLYDDLEIPLIPVLANMEMAGVLIDRDFLAGLSEEMTGTLNEREAQIHALAGEAFNVNSTQQLNTILFEKLGLSTAGLKKTKSGGFSLTAGVLEELAESEDHEILRLIMEYRSLAKLLGTYIDALPRLINPNTGRVHTSFNQTGAVTGRLSSNNPNLQNIPIRTEEGRRVRRAFIAEAGNLLLSVDYSQIELRILAHYSGDESLRNAFLDGQDIHRATAAKVFSVKPDEVDSDQRRFAKSVNFGLMYGMGAFRLARDTDLTLADAEDFIEAYFNNFPGVRDFLEATKEVAARNGYVETLYGRRRFFPELQRDDGNKQHKQRAEREAINTPIQGTAADIMKRAMIQVDERLKRGKFTAQMLLQVHDELVIEAPEDEIEDVQQMVIETMEAAADVLDVPVVAEAHHGPNWAELA
jgi:DNA polymerase-1